MFAVGLTQLRVGAPGVVFESPLGRVRLGERAVAVTMGAIERRPFYILCDCYAERGLWEKRLLQRQTHRPRNAEQIMNAYENMHYKMESCDGHIRIDCGAPADGQVEKVVKAIEQLRFEEKGM